jgi:hypothetical protein
MRQVHLDFHNSERLGDIGQSFDSSEFARTLVEANVNWVTLFGKCHHGWCYYPSKVGPIHPGLKFDLLGEQIEACRKHDIFAPVYVDVRVDERMARQHPEYQVRLRDGKTWGPGVFESPPYGWHNLCMNHPEYLAYLEALVEELIRSYDVDGLFFDMCYDTPYPGCFCENCLSGLRQRGCDIGDDDSHQRQEHQIFREYTSRLRKAVSRMKKSASVYFNGRIGPKLDRDGPNLTHIEIEALPTGGWGYGFFPFWVRLCRTRGLPTQGMTGRFHKSWADFGGLKTLDQLRYEVGTMLASCSAVSIGDQLHPRGRLDKGVYEVVGTVFKEVKSKEPWCAGAEPVVEVAVVNLPQAEEPGHRIAINSAAEGAAKMLLELKHQFNIELPTGDFAKYKVLILPDNGTIDEDLRRRLKFFIQKGGRILLSFKAGLNSQSNEFAVPEARIAYKGDYEYRPCFMRLPDEFRNGIPPLDYVFYGATTLVKPKRGARSFGRLVSSYFNRNYQHYTSHLHSPADRVTPYPVVTQSGSVIYIAAEIFNGYLRDAYHVYKRIVDAALNRILPEPLLKCKAPASMEISLTSQKKGARLMAHLVNYQPQRRHTQNSMLMNAERSEPVADIEYIESTWPTKDIELAIRSAKPPQRVYLAPQNTDLHFSTRAGYATFIVPEVASHQVVALEY